MRGGLRDLRAVVTLAEERHFGRAAERLGIAQPQLSQLIARLESNSGIQIFIRRPRVTPTAAGAAFIETARELLSDLQRGLDTARRIQEGQEGVIRIGIVDTVMLTDLPMAFRAFRERSPRVQFIFREMHSMGLAEAVETNQIDIAFARQSWSSSEISERAVYNEPFVAVHDDRKDFIGNGDFSLNRLADEPFILFPPELAPALHEQILTICRDAGFTPRIAHLAKGWAAALALVRSGFGVTVGPACLQKLRWPGLCFRNLPDCAIQSTIFMLWKDRQSSPAARALIESIGLATPPGHRNP
jgi:DNA-binding transcriptional LysR family regulator